ncbi:MOSC domain-containing protein [Candidatus Blastococcus massiliensis]|uniref:MOSC domain-containing protein n=1 Tax=Candidatus Blastococcus massiliensis TaxID=1470358 RepID=UPI0004B7D718|nr:MOSC N-terminal beta barrel domain-containing protein [Candidatus Blastococcus massiliensis]
MRVLELWRYPVKSLQGERLTEVHVGPLGIPRDRGWALFDRDTGVGLTARRVPELLFGSARVTPDGGVEVVLPDGTVAEGPSEIPALLSDWLGRRVELREATGNVDPPTYEDPGDETADGPTEWQQWEGATGPFHDSPRIRLSLVSTGTLGDWDRRRFRANVLLDGEGEDRLGGRGAVLGDAELRFGAPIFRCVMTTRPQAGGIARDTSVLKTIHRERDGLLAVRAAVLQPGTVRVGDLLEPAAD